MKLNICIFLLVNLSPAAAFPTNRIGHRAPAQLPACSSGLSKNYLSEQTSHGSHSEAKPAPGNNNYANSKGTFSSHPSQSTTEFDSNKLSMESSYGDDEHMNSRKRSHSPTWPKQKSMIDAETSQRYGDSRKSRRDIVEASSSVELDSNAPWTRSTVDRFKNTYIPKPEVEHKADEEVGDVEGVGEVRGDKEAKDRENVEKTEEEEADAEDLLEGHEIISDEPVKAAKELNFTDLEDFIIRKKQKDVTGDFRG